MVKLNSRFAVWCLAPVAAMALWACSDQDNTSSSGRQDDLAAAFATADFPHEASDIAADFWAVVGALLLSLLLSVAFAGWLMQKLIERQQRREDA
mgnify:CR=1 FL=1